MSQLSFDPHQPLPTGEQYYDIVHSVQDNGLFTPGEWFQLALLSVIIGIVIIFTISFVKRHISQSHRNTRVILSLSKLATAVVAIITFAVLTVISFSNSLSRDFALSSDAQPLITQWIHDRYSIDADKSTIHNVIDADTNNGYTTQHISFRDTSGKIYDFRRFGGKIVVVDPQTQQEISTQ